MEAERRQYINAMCEDFFPSAPTPQTPAKRIRSTKLVHTKVRLSCWVGHLSATALSHSRVHGRPCQPLTHCSYWSASGREGPKSEPRGHALEGLECQAPTRESTGGAAILRGVDDFVLETGTKVCRRVPRIPVPLHRYQVRIAWPVGPPISWRSGVRVLICDRYRL